MDPLNDCPICFETYEPEPEIPEGEERPEPVGRHWAVKLDCCQQSLCCHCQLCLARCPFCRIRWHGSDDEEENENGGHFWQRRSFPNPILTVWGTTLAFDAIRVMASAGMSGVRLAATAAAAAVAEASPAVLVGGAAGAAAIAGGLALMKAAEHRPDMAERLRLAVRDRERYELVPDEERHETFQIAMQKAVVCIWDALQWHLSPQWAGMPHVYTGSVWRAEARLKHHQKLSALLSAPGASSSSDQQLVSRRFWGDLIFLFLLWLDFNPHTPNWGSSNSYGLPPMHLCWHNRWREDLRHVVSDFARYLHSDAIEGFLPEKETEMAECMVGMLDHILSWEVVTLDRGSSDLIKASWWNYPSFCKNLQERFAEAWAATVAPPEAEVECRSFQTHAEAMGVREIPEDFRDLWSM